MPGNGWRFITAVTKLSNDYGAARVLTQRIDLNSLIGEI